MNKNVMMGALAGFALAAAIVILFAIMNDSIKTEDDIERALGIPTLAVIPDRKDYIDDHGGSKKKKGKEGGRVNGGTKGDNDRSETRGLFLSGSN